MDEHQEYLIGNLTRAILEKESYDDDPMELAQSLASLIEEFPENVKLQSCFSKVLGQVLAKDDDVDYIALVKIISFLPTSCDARTLSLTRLKMMLDVCG